MRSGLTADAVCGALGVEGGGIDTMRTHGSAECNERSKDSGGVVCRRAHEHVDVLGCPWPSVDRHRPATDQNEVGSRVGQLDQHVPEVDGELKRRTCWGRKPRPGVTSVPLDRSAEAAVRSPTRRRGRGLVIAVSRSSTDSPSWKGDGDIERIDSLDSDAVVATGFRTRSPILVGHPGCLAQPGAAGDVGQRSRAGRLGRSSGGGVSPMRTNMSPGFSFVRVDLAALLHHLRARMAARHQLVEEEP